MTNFTSKTSFFSHKVQPFNSSTLGSVPFFVWFHLGFVCLPCSIYLPYLIFVTYLSFISIAYFFFWVTRCLERCGSRCVSPGPWGRQGWRGAGQRSLLPGPGGAACHDWLGMKSEKRIWHSVIFPQGPFCSCSLVLWYYFLRLLWVFFSFNAINTIIFSWFCWMTFLSIMF